MDLMEDLSVIMQQLHDSDMVPFGGIVKAEGYERARQLNEEFREHFADLEAAENKMELCWNVWPYPGN